MATDRELIEKVKHGEQEAYSQLFQKYYSQIYAICLAILKNPQDSEELTQEIFILAYQKLNQLRKPEKFFPWLKKITRNQSKNRIQKSDPKIVSLDFAKSQEVSDDPESQVLRQELMDSIMQAIRSLPDKDRQVVQARIDGLNHTEISERFGISIQASMNRLHRARKQLAEHIKGMLSVIFGLPNILNPKKIISGGIMAMKTGTATKITIGIIGILILGSVGFLVTKNQLNANKASEEQIATIAGQGSASMPGNASSKSVSQNSGKQDVARKNELDKWNAFKVMLDEMDENRNTVTGDSINHDKQNQSDSKMKYNETYDKFTDIIRNMEGIKAEIASRNSELKRLGDEWIRNVGDPKNLTEEEKRLTTGMKEVSSAVSEELKSLSTQLDSFNDSLINEIKIIAPGAIQTAYKDTPKGAVNIVRIDYGQVRSALGSLPEETDTYLSEFFAGFEGTSLDAGK
jgi:RNA polymerase sigma-70 factor, ECF subfamily